MSGPRVVCLGDIMTDVVAALPGPLAPGSDTPADVRLVPGGSAANTAAWLAAEGVPTVFVGRVGADAFGEVATAALRAAGVEVAVGTDPAAPTGLCIVLVGPDGERTMVPCAGANATLAPHHLAADLAGPGDRLHLSGYSLLNDGSRSAARAALAAAVRSGAAVSVDAASSGPILAVGASTFLGWLPESALLIANRDEAAALTGCADPVVAAAALAERQVEVVVKCGIDGALVADHGTVLRVPGRPATAVDSTGAGDAFAAGLLAALFDGADLAAAAARGVLLGARAVTHPGGRPVPA